MRAIFRLNIVNNAPKKPPNAPSNIAGMNISRLTGIASPNFVKMV